MRQNDECELPCTQKDIIESTFFSSVIAAATSHMKFLPGVTARVPSNFSVIINNAIIYG